MEKELENFVIEYIENEIDYIENEVDFRDMQENVADYKKDLKYLKSINNNKISEIASKVRFDSELYEKINELIHYYLYHDKD